MYYKYFSKNGKILPISEAVVPLASVEYSYGFGVYESIRVKNKNPIFLSDHLSRLMDSAKIISLEHLFSEDKIAKYIAELIEKNSAETCNLKILLIGAPNPEEAQLNIICLNPLFPDKKIYRDGAALITYKYERTFPRAKSLNMLSGYLAYRSARQAGAYDALLINRHGFITEGTRTNFFCLKDNIIFTPPEAEILPGVTRKKLLELALANGYQVEEKNIKPEDLVNFDGAFISSTSAKIVPIKKVDELILNPPPVALKKLMAMFDPFLEISN
jgi:branched-subunit amino acid aminotransferase/4-amino-4-deoxychorismate lyase